MLQETSGDVRISELVGKGYSWVQNIRRALTPTTSGCMPGFHLGAAGWWSVQMGLSEQIPEAKEDLATTRLSLASKPLVFPIGTPSALSCGIGGTLLGVLALMEDDFDSCVPAARDLVGALIRSARFSEAGVSWDRFAHASRPCLGFANGSAGIDYALAGARLGIDCSALIAASIAHSNAEYRPDLGNWPDYEGEEDRSKDAAFQAKLKAAIKSGDAGELLTPADSASWSTGAAGILLSRATVMATTRNAELAKICRADCDRATVRIERFLQIPQATADLTLSRGLCGILLAVHSCQHLYPPAVPLLAKIRLRLNEVLESGKADLRLNDNSFFTGMSGIAYALLKCESSTPVDNCVAPGLAEITGSLKQPQINTDEQGLTEAIERIACEQAPTGTEGEAREARPASYVELYRARLPRHSAIPEFLAAAKKEIPLSLEKVRQLAEKVIPAGVSAITRAALDHELELAAKVAAQSGNSFLFLREQHKFREAGVLFRNPDRRVALHTAFRLDGAIAELLSLPFDPESPTEALAEKPTFVLRVSGSLGVAEQKVSPLCYHLLDEFRTSQPAIEAIGKVTQCVKVEADKVPQVAELCFQYIRQIASVGVLIVEPVNRLTLFAAQTTRRKMRRQFFPSVK